MLVRAPILPSIYHFGMEHYTCQTVQKEMPKRTKRAIPKLQSTSLHGIAVSDNLYLPFKTCLFSFLDVRKATTFITSENFPPRRKGHIPNDSIFHIISIRNTDNFTEILQIRKPIMLTSICDHPQKKGIYGHNFTLQYFS